MSTLSSSTDPTVERSVERYRRLLWIYPTSFRDEYGEDLVQNYRDLLSFNTDGRSLWWRTARDLIGSATRERAALMSPNKRPSSWVTLAIVLAAALGLLVIGGTGVLLVPAVVFVALPVFGVSRFLHAWRVRRSTGGPILGHLLLGVACILPAAVFFAVFGEEAGYWLFMAAGGTLMVSAAVGIVWAAVAIVRRPESGARRPWARAALVLVPSLAILGFIIGASINSYLRTIGPAGDHSVQNSSPDSRALWVAAGDGDLDEAELITTNTCADPWVRFTVDGYGNRENARGHAIINGHSDIEKHLDDYMDEWVDRCGKPE